MYNSRTTNSPSVNPNVYGASGFYNAESSGTQQAQQNIADATKNLLTAQNNASNANTAYASAVNSRDAARQAALDCDARRAQKNTGPAKNKACGNRDELYNKWRAGDAVVAKAKSTLDAANAAVVTAQKALDSANAAALAVKNADPNYAIQQQQIVAQQNIAVAQTNAAQQTAQAQLQAQTVQQTAQRKATTLYVVGGLVVVAVGLFFWLRKGKGAKAPATVTGA